MKYYYHPGSPNCRKVSALIEHHGLHAEFCLVDLPGGEQTRPEFLAVNPNGMVPALEDGDLKLSESNAILVYLAEKAGSDLWPEPQRIDIMRWMFWEQSHLMYATGTLFFQRVIKPMIGAGDPDETRVTEAIAKFQRLTKVLDEHLDGREWLVGDALSLADLAVASQLTVAGPAGLPLEEFGNVSRWLANLDAVPAWKASAPKMG